jgi:hypothetical protein
MSAPHRNCYDIHHIITVASEVKLPELERFRVDRELPEADIRVQIGHVPTRMPDWEGPEKVIHFHENAGSRGFAIEIRYGDHIDVLASSLLGHSPHVLYTNVIEPVLRWSFVERGYALVHGACLAVDDQAFLVTARTDTGKTTTMLRVLDSRPDYAFISDDLTLVSPDGRVLTYPKPLTISRHTLVAVNTPLLSWSERFALVFQSRLHSKSGRRFGLLLAKSHLPMATTNAIIQSLVPPPKYHVERLVPHARVAREATLAGLVVIERGSGGEVYLEGDEALDVLMANCEDSYGFPPYADIKESLYWSHGQDLRVAERGIVAAAFADCPAILMRSETRDWYQMLPDFIGGALAARGLLASRFGPQSEWAAARSAAAVGGR